MRKVILSMLVSADGFTQGTSADPNKALDWFVWNEEMLNYTMDFFTSVDTLLYGRVAYELMLSYWPAAATNPSATQAELIFANKMNNYEKIVFSKTLNKVEWNARLVKDNIAEEVNKLKQQPGKDMVIFGGSTLASTFMQLGLIDEFRLIINPVVLGKGKPYFKDLPSRLQLKLTKAQSFGCGNVILIYQPEKKEQ